MRNEAVENLLYKPYVVAGAHGRRYVCWHLCRKVYELLGCQLKSQSELRQQLAEPVVPCIVMFRAVMSWHSGVVWPDALHFIHACSVNMFDPNPNEYVIKKDRLTAWPYKMIIEGFYKPAEDQQCPSQ